MNFKRRSIRLKGYDYSENGLYYITISTYKDQYLFGEIKDKKMILNHAGEMVKSILFEIKNEFLDAKVLNYVIMPNHVHFIVEIDDDKNGVDMESCKDGVDMESTRTMMDPNGFSVGADSISALKDSISALKDSISALKDSISAQMIKERNVYICIINK